MIVDCNRGQIPYTLDEAFLLIEESYGYTREDISKYLETNEIYIYSGNGFYFGIKKEDK